MPPAASSTWCSRETPPGSREPILDLLETIECRDAILTPDGGEPDWPDTDVIIGNLPFLGGKLLISNLGEEYISTLFRVYERGVCPARPIWSATGS